MKTEIVLAADLGGTNLRVAAVDSEGRIWHRLKTKTPRVECADEIVREVIKSVENCRTAVKSLGHIKALGMAVPASVNSKDGIILKAPNVSCLDGFRFAAAISDKLEIPVFLENDANAAAVGEHTFGAARGVQNAIEVTLGTGVGGGIIINGQILRGINGTAGEIGHICVEPFGAPCGCGSRGCLEQYSSATAIIKLANTLKNQYPKSVLHNLLPLTARSIYQAGKKGDQLALEVFNQMGFYLGVALASLINVINPEVIVIGGGVSAGWSLFINHTLEQIRRRTFDEPGKTVKVVRASLNDDAGLLGASRISFEAFNSAQYFSNRRF